MQHKIEALSIEHQGTNLLPFMMVAESTRNYDLDSVYELLRIKPDVIKKYSDSLFDVPLGSRVIKRRRK